ncbi:MAG TPA: hypothetical protein VGA37_09785 [Gemmatimonadales bacterium]
MTGTTVRWVGFLALAACAGERATPPVAATIRDSAGITIVENRMDTAAARAGWSISAAPTWAIGGLDVPDSQQLFRIGGARRLADGRLAVIDGGAAELRIYDATRALVKTLGRKGEGPGEFTEPRLAGVVPGDSLIVYDGRLRRVSVLHPDGGFVRSYQVGTEGGGYPVAFGITSDGGVAIGGGMFFSSTEGFPRGAVRPNSRYVVLAPDGSVRGDFGEVPAAEMFARSSSNGMFSFTSLPFGRITAAASAPDLLWMGTGDAWELRAYAHDAALRRIVRFDRPQQPVTDALRNAYLADLLEDAEDDNAARDLRDRFPDMPSPALVPPYQRLLVDALGSVWIGEYRLPGLDATTYTVIDAEGRAVGRVSAPAHTLLLDIGADYVLGVTLDELDVERLTLWALQRGASAQ